MLPTPRREWIGFLLILVSIITIDRFSTSIPATYSFFKVWAGLLYLVEVIFVACWSGLRSALASCVMLIAYAWIVYHYPVSSFGQQTSRATSAIISTAIIYPLFAVIAGLVQNELRHAKIRELDAVDAATAESEHRKLAEAELWASEEMRRVIVDSSGDAIVGLDGHGKITLWNPNAEALFGWTQEEALGSPVSERILSLRGAKNRPVDLAQVLHTADASTLREHIEMVAATKSGSEISIELYIADHRVDDGSMYVMFVRDISERKRAEQAIQELNTHLEERVAERTSQLEAANGELIGFTYSVSHDLRAPLRAIVSNSRMVCEDSKEKLDQESYDRLKRLESSALKMSDLIENLLKFARIGQVPMKPEMIDISAMAREIAADLQSDRKGSAEIQPGLTVKGDPEMIRMVMVNLMENAWKYVRPDQNPKVEVGLTNEGAIFVRDEGIGFDMQYIDKIWEPFERLHRDSEFPGTGIGLANSKRIVSRHGGRLWAESVPDKGTTMYFVLERKASTKSAKRRAGYAS